MGKKLTEPELAKYEALLRQMLAMLSGDIANLQTETTHEVREGEILSTDDVGAEVSALELSMELLQRDERRRWPRSSKLWSASKKGASASVKSVRPGFERRAFQQYPTHAIASTASGPWRPKPSRERTPSRPHFVSA